MARSNIARSLVVSLAALFFTACATSEGPTTTPGLDGGGVEDGGAEDSGADTGSGGDDTTSGTDAGDAGNDAGAPRCGDGVVDEGETCDSGELNGTEGEPCTTACVIDADRDGFSPPDDCNDGDDAINPGADELCNGIDDDCNEAIDDDPVDNPDCGLPAIVRFTASRTTVPAGATVSVEWEVTQATSVTIASSPEGLGFGDVGASGFELVTISETTTFILAAANDNGSATDEITIELVPALTIVTPDSETSTLPSAVVDEEYSFTFEAVGGRTPYAWSIDGDLPTGVEIDESSGELAGTPTTFGEFSFDVVVQDALMDAQVARRTLTWRVDSSVVTIGSTELADGVVGEVYADAVAAFGGTAPYTWSWSGEIPGGLTLGTDGAIAGTPEEAGEFSVTIRVEDASDPVTSDELTLPLVVIAANPSIITESLVDGQVGAEYVANLEAAGGTAPLLWSISSLPDGLTGDPDLGTITGTPTTEETVDVSILVTDGLGRTDETTIPLTIGPPTPRVLPGTLPNGLEGQSYSADLAAESGTAPYTFTLTGGALPSGVTLDPSGLLSGTPAESGTFSLVVEVTDSRGLTDDEVFELTVDPMLRLGALTLPDGFAAVPYEATITATGGVEPLIWTVVGTLPPGTELIESGGRTATISGTPESRGTFSFAIQLRDSRVPSQFVTENGIVRVEAAPPQVSEDPLPEARRGASYAYTVVAIGGTPPYTWSASGLPPGLAMNPSTGAISGTPMASGSFTPTVTVTDSIARSDDAVLPLVVRPPAPVVSTDPLADGVVGAAYAGALVGSEGTPPYTWEIVGGALPSGLVLAPDGSISGTPATTGSTGFTVELTDSLGETASGAQSITVYESLAITTTTIPNATRGSDYSTTVGSTGGKSPISWRIISTTVPGGATIGGSSGQITLNASATGTFTILVEASDSVVPAQRVERSFTLTVDASAPVIDAAALPSGQELVPYLGATLTASDGTPPLTWTLDGGSFPPGLTLSSGGAISGTPSAEGFFTFTVRVTDALGRSSTREFTIDIDPPAIVPEHPMVFGALPDISAFGTEQTISTSDDAVTEDVALGFDFEFYGVTYPDVRISTNGAVYFDATSTTTGLPQIPNASSPHAFVAPFSDDLDPGDSGQIFTATLGVAPYRVFVVQWKDVDFFSGSEAKMNFAVALYETTNQVQILHGRNIPGNGTSAGRAAGNSATVGIENTDGSGGVSLVYNEESGVRPGQVWLLTPDAGGSDYTTEQWFALPSAFEDISTTGTELAAITSDDDSEAFDFGFSFSFYGTAYTSVTASSNGYLAFTGSGTDFGNDPLPSSGIGAIIAPLWDDQDSATSGETDPRVLWEVRGTAPNRRLIVQWDTFRWLGDSTASLTYQAILHESSNHIEFNYGNMSDSITAFRSRGNSATVGVNAGDGVEGAQSSYNEQVVETGDSVLVIPRNWADTSAYSISGNSTRFLDISVSGTLASSVSSDDSTQTVAIPFEYEHFGNPYSSLLVSSNGYVTFGTDGTDFSNDAIGTATDPDDFLAPLWDDLNPNAGQVFTHTIGTTPNRQFIIQWDKVSFLSDSSSRLTFQVVLNESGGASFNYGPLQTTTAASQARGGSATVGAENASGDAGTQLCFNQDGLITTGGFVRVTNR